MQLQKIILFWRDNMEQSKIMTYLKKYADMYCNGDLEAAKEHAIVKEVIKSLEKE